MSRFTLSIIGYSLLVIGVAVGISCLVILRPLKSDIAHVSQDQQDLKQELSTDLSDIKQSLEATNLKLDARMQVPSLDNNGETSSGSESSTLKDSVAARRLATINAAIDDALTELETPSNTPAAIGGITSEITIASNKWRSIEVYDTPNPSGLTVGSIRYGTRYPVTDSQPSGTSPDWYQITLPDSTTGWVMSTYVKEVI